MDVARFKKKPVMGIVRGIEQEQIEPLIESVIDAGLETLEITMNTPQAASLLQKAKKAAAGRLMLGAGTVLDTDSLKQARDAGATFIVMPVLVREVLEQCVKNEIPAFPGALTPQEIYRAWKEGATMVKIFPARCFGPIYFSEIKGPFNDIELMAVAGVTAQNMPEYFHCGASAIAFGASVFRKEWLQKRDYASIRSSISAYLKNL